MSKVITVKTPDSGSYYILIGQGGLQKLSKDAKRSSADVAPRTVVVTNETLAPLYGQELADALPNSKLVVIPDGERYKNLETIQKLYKEFIDAGLTRDGVVFALGGGVLGDTAGFAAATYMRGVSLVQIPTSLLAMVDASVGGKVGVDLPEGKNLVGAFKQPDMVMIDLNVLESLPNREWCQGMAEVIKHGLLADETLLSPELHKKDRAEELIYRAIQVKVNIVEEDPFEKGIRAHLNLGHTFAHAIERVTNYGVPHGEAVAMGLLAAAGLSYMMELCDASMPEMVEDILTQAGLPTTIGDLDPEKLYDAMSTDKKWKTGKSRFVLLEGVGKPTIVENVPRENVIRVLEQMR